MKEKIDWKILKAELGVKIREFYPYFLGFYILSLVIAIFSKTWRAFFYWPGLHVSIILLTILFALISDFSFNFKEFLFFLKKKILATSRRTRWKVLIITIILFFSLFKGIGVIEFMILTYALVSLIFILDSRLAIGTGLIFLAACPLLLIIKEDSLAEDFAIYVYYLLVIACLTQIRELFSKKKQEIGANIKESDS
jgi:hypothetical protein